MRLVAFALSLALSAPTLSEHKRAFQNYARLLVAQAFRPANGLLVAQAFRPANGRAGSPEGLRYDNFETHSKRVEGPALSERPRVEGCFLLHEVGKAELRRRPADLCTTRLLPASTFKIPHALAALDAGVVSGPDELMKYDGAPTTMEAWRHDHTLATAMRDSVVWYFQRIAQRLGMERERAYLRKFEYGNADPSSDLTTFWLGGSLQITPEEQLGFMRRLYADELPASPAAVRTVRQLIVQPQGVITNALGRHPFAAPWPAGTTISAKTGSGTDRSGKSVRWLVGHVARGDRAWLFVSCVAGGEDTPALAAVDQAAAALREERILR